MILLDTDLDPGPSPQATTAKRSAARVPAVLPKNLRIPTVRTLSRFLREAQAAVRLRGQVTVLLTTDTAIRRLNRQFRGKNKATDVLSFPAPEPIPGCDMEPIAGDLAVSVPTARRQAVEQGHPLSTEIKVLILHGLLHLAGYDHESDNGKMARRERILRARLRLPQGLIERVEGQKPLTPKSAAKTAKRSPEPATKAGCPILSAASCGKGGNPQTSARPRSIQGSRP